MHALFVGGTIDNSELDLDGAEPPARYPPDTGGGQSRYRLHAVGRRDDEIVYAVYGGPDIAHEDVQRVSEERDYARRFEASETIVG
ncbi:hypothetical protein CMZ84_15945 [Lysobacteraceae bacterium NML93-0399]|nr:hypothetical protein CMZ84_15945 [Xanthomonadaceae bacterium NML93-0399]